MNPPNLSISLPRASRTANTGSWLILNWPAITGLFVHVDVDELEIEQRGIDAGIGEHLVSHGASRGECLSN